MGVWEKNDDMRCVFCKDVPDSLDHLFFGCDFSRRIWDSLNYMVRMDHAPYCWSQIKEFMLKRPINKSIWSILHRLLIGASIYFVWKERIIRMFQGNSRSVDVILDLIKDTVRLSVMSLTVNVSVQVFEAASLWNFHVDRVVSLGTVRDEDGILIFGFFLFWVSSNGDIMVSVWYCAAGYWFLLVQLWHLDTGVDLCLSRIKGGGVRDYFSSIIIRPWNAKTICFFFGHLLGFS
ncbi:hypothetical protein Tco_1117471 [Tanacetum coccineum]